MSQRNAGNPSKYAPRAAKPAAAASSSSAAASSAAISTPTEFPTALVAKLAVWSFCWYLSCKIEFGSIFVVCSAIVAMFLNLSSSSDSKSDNKLSAYSVFNPGAQRIAGSMDAEAIEDQLRHKARSAEKKAIDLDIGSSALADHPARKSKMANSKCVCGSGKKYKVCCSPLTVSDKTLDREWEEWEEEWGAKR